MVFWAVPGPVDMLKVGPNQVGSPREYRGEIAKFVNSGCVLD